jgi:hypothetical protein
LRDGLDGEVTSSRLLVDWWDDFRGGGLGGRFDDPLVLLFSFVLTPARTVEFDDDEVDNSLTTANPCGSALTEPASFEVLPALRRVTGGRVSDASACRILLPGAAILIGATNPGDCDDIDVGVVSRL